jgi:uncharacterized lipoprotein
MRLSNITRHAPAPRTLLAMVVAAGVLATASCSWFRKDASMYRMSEESRPLEVPPDLDLPDTGAASATATAEGTTSVMRSQVGRQAPAAQGGFAVAAPRADVFARVGAALEGMAGVTIASRAELLGSYDVNYGGSNFLVRVTAEGEGSRVAAVDPRGVPATGEAPTALLAALQAALAQ